MSLIRGFLYIPLPPMGPLRIDAQRPAGVSLVSTDAMIEQLAEEILEEGRHPSDAKPEEAVASATGREGVGRE